MVDLSKIVITIELTEEQKRINEQMNEAMKQAAENALQPAEEIAEAIREMGKAMVGILDPIMNKVGEHFAMRTAPILGIRTHYYQQLADEQRREAERKLFQVGDGQTSLHEAPQRKFMIFDDPYQQPDEDAQEKLVDWFEHARFANAPNDIVKSYRTVARQRSRDDLRKKTRELRKRKGKL